MATIAEVMGYSAEQLAAMSDEQLTTLLADVIHLERSFQTGESKVVVEPTKVVKQAKPRMTKLEKMQAEREKLQLMMKQMESI